MGETQSVLRLSGKTSCFKERLKRFWWNIIKTWALSDLKLLDPLFNYLSWRRYWYKLASTPLKKSLKSLNELRIDPIGIYLLKVNNKNSRTRCKICSKLIIKRPEQRRWRRSGVFIVIFEHISHLVPVFLLLILNM